MSESAESAKPVMGGSGKKSRPTRPASTMSHNSGVESGDKGSVGSSTEAGSEKTSATEGATTTSNSSGGGGVGGGGGGVGVSVCIPESVVAPLIGAGANVYILTNELTQSMRQKLGSSWPLVQDTLRLNSRYAKALAGGLLATVAVVVVWKIVKRFTAAANKAKKPKEGGGGGEEEEEESSHWTATKTYELTPVPENKPLRGRRHQNQNQQSPISEGDESYPAQMLPNAKIQLRVAEPNPAAVRATGGHPETCKARDPASRHRHTRHPDRRSQGEEAAPAPAGGEEGYGPWHSQQAGDNDVCNCPEDPCAASMTPQLLYSVKERHLVHHHHHHQGMDPHVDPLLGCRSTLPTSLYPGMGVLESAAVCPHNKPCPSSQPLQHSPSSCPHCVNGTLPFVPSHHQHHSLYRSPLTPEVNVMSTHNAMYPCVPPIQCGAGPLPGSCHVDAAARCLRPDALKEGWASGVSLCSMEEACSVSSASTGIAGCQAECRGRRANESRARSVNQQTGQPVEEDPDMPGNDTATHAHFHPTPHTLSLHSQTVPTRAAQSPVTSSLCTNAPIRTDNSPIHVHSSVASHPTRMPCLPSLCQPPHGAVIHSAAAGGECSGAFPTLHHHRLSYHHPATLDGLATRALPVGPPTPHLQPLTFHHHQHVDHVLPSQAQQQHTPRASQQQQQEEPVVQHPSDSSVSQNSSEPQESRQGEGSHLAQETVAPSAEAPHQDRTLMLHQHPHVHHHHHPGFSSLRAPADYPHADYPWQRTQGSHTYQPTPLYLWGQQASPNPKHYHPWSTPTPAMFVAPSFVSPSTANLFVSSPAGIMAAAAASPPHHLLPSSFQGQVMAGGCPWQAPYLSTAHAVPRHPHSLFYNSNFNLSNSNMALQNEAGQNMFVQNEAGRNMYLQNEAGHNTFLQNEAGHNTFLQHEAGHNTFLQHEAGHNTFLQHEAGQNTFLQHEAGHNTFLQPEVGHNTFLQHEAGHNTFLQHEAGHNAFMQHEAGQNVFQQREAGQNVFLQNEAGHMFLQNEEGRNMFLQHEAGQSMMNILPFPPPPVEPGRLRVAESDHSIHSNVSSGIMRVQSSNASTSSSASLNTTTSSAATPEATKNNYDVQHIPASRNEEGKNSSQTCKISLAVSTAEESGYILSGDEENRYRCEAGGGVVIVEDNGEAPPLLPVVLPDTENIEEPSNTTAPPPGGATETQCCGLRKRPM